MVTSTHVKEDDRIWASIAHLSQLLALFTGIGGWVGPLIVWIVQHEKSRFVGDAAKEALNFQISLLIYGIVSGILCFVLVGFALLAILWIMALVFPILAGIEAQRGGHYRYPLTLRFIS